MIKFMIQQILAESQNTKSVLLREVWQPYNFITNMATKQSIRLLIFCYQMIV